MRRVSRLMAVGASTVACATLPAQYPSWEPAPPSVPVVRDRRLALADLEVSREMWLERNWGSYSYVRMRQVAEDRVELTFLVVEEGRVVERALLTSATGIEGLGDRTRGEVGATPELVWRERGPEVGKHEEGETPLTVPQLYDLCRDRVLSVPNEHPPRLSFHRDGLLQHCGFSSDDCPDCPVVSLQTVSSITPRPWQAPRHLLCTDRYGVFLAGNSPLTGFGCEMCNCEASNSSDPNPPPPTPPVPTLSREELELCRLNGDDCLEPAEGVGDICKIDPAACPLGELQPDRANWFCKHLLSADCGAGFTRPLTSECIALPRPTSWSDAGWRHRCLPER